MPTRIKVLYALLLMLISLATSAQFFADKSPKLLPEAEAFKVISYLDKSQTLKVAWSIADDYYMYRDMFDVISDTAKVSIKSINYPTGVIEHDLEFGDVEVYFFNVEISVPLTIRNAGLQQATFTLLGQGCNKPIGVCYPPMKRTVSIEFDDLTQAHINTSASTPAKQNNEKRKSFFSYLLTAFGSGLLLSLTPCVLPMIPILAGVIAGQQNPSKMRSGWLAICYVAGTIVTYIVAGAIAGATGAQLQAYFQSPLAITIICVLLALLALSLFGVFKLQLPATLQSKLSITPGSRSPSVTSFALGLVSALVVGACVSPVLILALGAAITQGDPVLGAGIMGAMALGMGMLLIAFGFGAGWLLPKSGTWMTHIQILFGFMILAVIIYLLGSFPALPILLLWGTWFIALGLYLWHIAKPLEKSPGQPLSSVIGKAIGIAAIFWGSLCLLGSATGGHDVLRPLANLSTDRNAQNQHSTLPFAKTTTLGEVEVLLAKAKANQQPVLIDFYADWCPDCIRMQRTTFQDLQVTEALKNWQLIEIDVTDTSTDSETVKRFFDVFGPPATLFLDSSGAELSELRQYGYMNAKEFLTHISGIKGS